MSQHVWLLITLCAGAFGVGGIFWAIHEKTLFDTEKNLMVQRIDALEEQLMGNPKSETKVGDPDSNPQIQRVENRRDQVQKSVSKIRELEYLKPIRYETLSRENLREWMLSEIDARFDTADFKNMDLAYQAMGFTQKSVPMRDTYGALTVPRTTSHYSPLLGKLFIVEDVTLERPNDRQLLAKHLTRAMQDQHHSMDRLPIQKQGNSDFSNAVLSLLNGEAGLVASHYLRQQKDWRSAMMDGDNPVDSETLEQRKKYQAAPPYLREMLQFPFIDGQQFCEALFARNGFRSLDAAYSRLPASTAEIIHPELYYRSPPFRPEEISWENPTVFEEDPIWSDVAGELGIRLYLSQYIDPLVASKAAAGWLGDRYLVYHVNDTSQCFWRSAWTSPEEAKAFADALQLALSKRYEGRESPRVYSVKTNEDEVILRDTSDESWSSAMEHLLKSSSRKPIE